MGRESRDNERGRLEVLESVQGHDSSVAHSWNHTGGQCPKCGCPKHEMMFCLPGQTKLPRVRGCELDGEHVHRLCGSCHYPWIERPMDHTVLAQEKGEVQAESELAALLAWMLELRGNPVEVTRRELTAHRGWTIVFARDLASDMMTASVRPPEDAGEPVHPGPGSENDQEV